MSLKKIASRVSIVFLSLFVMAATFCIYMYASGKVFYLALEHAPEIRGNIVELSYKIEREIDYTDYVQENKCDLGLEFVAYFNEYMAKNNCYADSRTGKGVTCNVTYAEYLKDHPCTPPAPPAPQENSMFILTLDDDHVGVFNRIDEGGALTSGEKRIRYYKRGKTAFIEPKEVALGRIQGASLRRAAYAIMIQNMFSGKLTLLGYADAELKPILQ